MYFFENTRKPVGLGGKIMVTMMNSGHGAMADWGFAHITIADDACVLDAGCGGGANIKKLLAKAPKGQVKGIDYSEVSVEKPRKVSTNAIKESRCEVLHASVVELPFAENTFDLVTAFETIYFWPGFADCFREVYRVTKSGGTFFICNESNGETTKDDKWAEKIGGMTIYNAAQILTTLNQAGFRDAKVSKNDKGWICVIARK